MAVGKNSGQEEGDGCCGEQPDSSIVLGFIHSQGRMVTVRRWLRCQWMSSGERYPVNYVLAGNQVFGSKATDRDVPTRHRRRATDVSACAVQWNAWVEQCLGRIVSVGKQYRQ